MKWLSRMFERRSIGPQFSGVFLAPSRTTSGEVVTPETALTCPPVKACIKALSEDTGKSPLRLRRAIGPDAYVDAREHDLFEILHALPNPETDAFTLIRQMTSDMLLHGVAYAQIIRANGRVQSLWRLDPRHVRVDRDEQRRKRWTVSASGGVSTFVFDPSMPPILEVAFDSPVQHARDLIGTYLALQKFTSKFFANGARPNGVLQSDTALNEEAIGRLRQSWQESFGGSGNAHKIAVLEEGLKYQSIASNNSDAQMNELLATLRNEICGVFRVPPYLISDLTHANYSNVEALSISYVSGTLDPLFRAWELSLRRDVLTARQYGAYTVEFDRSALIQSDVRSLYTALATARQAGIFSVNDCRRKLGMNPVENGDELLVNSALVPVQGGERHAA